MRRASDFQLELVPVWQPSCLDSVWACLMDDGVAMIVGMMMLIAMKDWTAVRGACLEEVFGEPPLSPVCLVLSLLSQGCPDGGVLVVSPWV